jgi:class I fructose-bisphosphate aldolase
MPTDTENLKNIVKAACGVPVVFSGGPYADTYNMMDYAKRIKEAGGYGMIVGRNVFQRERHQGKHLLKELHRAFRES